MPLSDVDPSRYFSPPSDDLHPGVRLLREIASPNDPYPEWARLQAEQDVHVEKNEDEVRVSLYGWDVVREAFQRADVGLSPVYREQLEPMTGPGMHCVDPPEHTEVRSTIEPMFRESVQALTDRGLREVARGLLGAFDPGDRAELIADFTTEYPPRVIARVLGLPEDHRPWYQFGAYQFSAGYMFSQMGAVEDGFVEEARDRLEAYFRALVSAVSPAEAPGLLARLVHEESGGRKLREEEIIGFLMHLAPASGTSGMALGSLIYGLLTHPSQHRRVREDLGRVPRAVEEGLRWEPPFAIVERQAHGALTLDGTTIPEGARLMLHIAAANRDPRRFDDPHAFDFSRERLGHMSFAAGPHVCLGETLARREMRAALRVLYEEYPGLHLDPEKRDEAYLGGGFWRGVVRLPVVLER